MGRGAMGAWPPTAHQWMTRRVGGVMHKRGVVYPKGAWPIRHAPLGPRGGRGAPGVAGRRRGSLGGVPAQPGPPPASPTARPLRAGPGGRGSAAESAGGSVPGLVPEWALGHRHRRHRLRAERHRQGRGLRFFPAGGAVRVPRGGLVRAELGFAAAAAAARGPFGRRLGRAAGAAAPALGRRPVPLRGAARGGDRPRGAPREVTGVGRGENPRGVGEGGVGGDGEGVGATLGRVNPTWGVLNPPRGD